jgi:two-component system chemotaxis response regulator CheB
MVCAVSKADQLDLSFRAIQAGALELVAKPSITKPDELERWGRALVESIRLMSEVPVVSRRRLAAVPDVVRMQAGRPLDIFALVSSTGGPPALATILHGLPAAFPVPIVVAQHITAGFTSGLVRFLSEGSKLGVEIASTGTVCRPGNVYLAPDGHHLELDARSTLRVSRAFDEGICPSGDRLLLSVASVYRDRGGAAVLTGMGEDGAKGLLALRRAGGRTLAQDASTSVVFGMPRASIECGAAEEAVPLHGIAPLIQRLCAAR